MPDLHITKKNSQPLLAFFLLFCLFVFFFFFFFFFSFFHPSRADPSSSPSLFFFFSSRRRPFTLSMALSVVFSLTHSLLRRPARHSLSRRPFSLKQWTRSPLSSVPNRLHEIAGATILSRISARSLRPSRLISSRY
jgi:hypothetical protein